TGDLGLHFNADDFAALQHEHDKGTNVRVGLRQELGPGMTLLASYMHADKTIDFSLPDPTIGQSFTLGRDENANSVEGQFLYRAPQVKVVAGAGYFHIGSDETTAFAIDDPVFGFAQTTVVDSKIKHTNLYAYAYWTPVKNLTLTLGASGDLFDQTG